MAEGDFRSEASRRHERLSMEHDVVKQAANEMALEEVEFFFFGPATFIGWCDYLKPFEKKGRVVHALRVEKWPMTGQSTSPLHLEQLDVSMILLLACLGAGVRGPGRGRSPAQRVRWGPSTDCTEAQPTQTKLRVVRERTN